MAKNERGGTMTHVRLFGELLAASRQNPFIADIFERNMIADIKGNTIAEKFWLREWPMWEAQQMIDACHNDPEAAREQVDQIVALYSRIEQGGDPAAELRLK